MKNLIKARALLPPQREDTLRREFSVHEFWAKNKHTLVSSWREWEESNEENLLDLEQSLLDSKLLQCVSTAWSNPSTESNVRELMTEISPGVFKFQLFDPQKISVLRDYIKKVEESQIPTKAPYGIVLNRKGMMLDKRSDGFLAAPSFQRFYEVIMNKYMRPISRLLYPEVTGYDSQTFGFSIHYKPREDESIRMHTDASSTTMNINLNLPGENFTGSEVDFYNSQTGKMDRVEFSPGVAVIHRGNIPHMAHSIKTGQRTNFVLWLFGKEMQVPKPGDIKKDYTPKERWKLSNEQSDGRVPF